MNRVGDLTGQQFGKLRVLRLVGKDKYYDKLWECECECGSEVVVRQGHLRSGHTVSCGCEKPQLNDFSGRRFGHLLVKNRVEDYVCPGNGKHYVRYCCECDCGNKITVIALNLKSGTTTSCGCQSPHAFKDLSGELFGNLKVIERVDDYVTPKGTKLVRYRCKCKCGNEVLALANTLRNGDMISCGCAYKSHGERYVCDILDNLEIPYTSHKKFDDCISDKGYKLSYDIYIPSKNALVECNGLQHYQVIEFFGGEERFQVQQRNDFLKRQFAESHGFHFLELDCRKSSRRRKIIEDEFSEFIKSLC